MSGTLGRGQILPPPGPHTTILWLPYSPVMLLDLVRTSPSRIWVYHQPDLQDIIGQRELGLLPDRLGLLETEFT